jgi:hypothetical protein
MSEIKDNFGNSETTNFSRFSTTGFCGTADIHQFVDNNVVIHWFAVIPEGHLDAVRKGRNINVDLCGSRVDAVLH